jgi:hypothetical protein
MTPMPPMVRTRNFFKPDGAFAAGVFLLLAATFYSVTLDRSPDPGAEDGAYAALAQALATGQGYADVWLADAPAETKYPFLFPLMLSPLYLVCGFNFFVFKYCILFSGLAGLFLGFLLLRRHEAAPAFWAVVASALSVSFGTYSRMIFPEIPFMAFMLAALIFGRRYCAQEKIVSLDGFLAFALITCAYFTRSIGICLLPALACGILLEKNGMPAGRRLAKASAACAVFLLPVLLWGVYAHAMSPGGGSYFRELLSDPYGDPSAPVTLGGLFISILKNVYAYVFYAVPQTISGFVFTRRSIAAAVLTAAVAAGFAVSWRNKASLMHYFVLFYMAVLAVWPWSKISGTRFIVPLVPLLFYFLFTGIAKAASFVPRYRLAIGAAATAALALGNLYNLPGSAMSVFHESEKQRRYYETALWVKQNSGPQERVMMLPSPAFYVWSSRKIVPLRCPVDEGKLLSAVNTKKPDLLLVTDRLGENELRCYNEPVVRTAESHGALFFPVMVRGGNCVYRIAAPSDSSLNAGTNQGLRHSR